MFIIQDISRVARSHLLHAAAQINPERDSTNAAEQRSAPRRQERSQCGQIRKVRTAQRALQELPRERAQDRLREPPQNASHAHRLVHQHSPSVQF